MLSCSAWVPASPSLPPEPSPPPGEEGGEDHLVCYDELPGAMETRIPPEHRILFIGEPPCITRYPEEYLRMFGTVVCPYDLPKYRGASGQKPCLAMVVLRHRYGRPGT